MDKSGSESQIWLFVTYTQVTWYGAHDQDGIRKENAEFEGISEIQNSTFNSLCLRYIRSEFDVYRSCSVEFKKKNDGPV